jgi:cysteine-rich repeat protein
MLVGALAAAPACFNPPADAGLDTAGPTNTSAATSLEDTLGASESTVGPVGTTSGSGGDATAGVDGSSSVGPFTTSVLDECGDGIVGGIEACDDEGETATCDADCTEVECGDAVANVTAGEQCDEGGEGITCDADCTAVECGDMVTNVAAGEGCDAAGETAACDADCTPAECGDMVTNVAAGEQCDDGNGVPGDGCNECLVVVACSAGASLLAQNPAGDMVVCDDPTDTVCEQDGETLCPAGWGLCTREQHINRNTGFDFAVRAVVVVGEIHCRTSGGAGHYTLSSGNLNQDSSLDCAYGSSRESCETGYGCNEPNLNMLCCAPTPSCGNGVVNAPEELCDDGNASEVDECLNSCGWRVPGNHGQPSCG